MKAAERIFKELESRASAGQVEVTEGSLRIAAEVTDFDRLGVAIYRLELEAADLLGEAPIESFGLPGGRPMGCAEASLLKRGTTTAPGSPAAFGRLSRVAENVSSKLTYLLEPLTLIEQEEGEQFLLIRSVPPHRQEGSIDYYEIRLVGGTYLSLERYSYQRDRRIREGKAMVFTREVFERLLEDLAEMMAA